MYKDKVLKARQLGMTNTFFGIAKDPEKMTRKERRQWYHRNRKRLELPEWGVLRETLK